MKGTREGPDHGQVRGRGEGKPACLLVVAPYPHGMVASQRFRHEHFLDSLRQLGWDIKEAAFWSRKAMTVLYRRGAHIAKAAGYVAGVLRRMGLLATIRRYDVIFVHREAIPKAPPWWEWLAVRWGSGRLVYDFDDAIWIPHSSSANPPFEVVPSHYRVSASCGIAHRVSCGNAFLADFARRRCPDVIVNPTVVDTESVHVERPTPVGTATVVGWTGTHSTLPHLEQVVPALRALRERVPFELRVVCNAEPAFQFPGLKFVPWRKESEIEDLSAFDVGLMPLPDTDWARGKCGFKLIQYMALGVAAVASPVGVNSDIVVHGQNGFLCSTDEEWIDVLERLLGDGGLRARIGFCARTTIVNHFSVASARRAFLATITQWEQ